MIGKFQPAIFRKYFNDQMKLKSVIFFRYNSVKCPRSAEIIANPLLRDGS